MKHIFQKINPDSRVYKVTHLTCQQINSHNITCMDCKISLVYMEHCQSLNWTDSKAPLNSKSQSITNESECHDIMAYTKFKGSVPHSNCDVMPVLSPIL